MAKASHVQTSCAFSCLINLKKIGKTVSAKDRDCFGVYKHYVLLHVSNFKDIFHILCKKTQPRTLIATDQIHTKYASNCKTAK